MSSLVDQISQMHLVGVAVGAGLGAVCRAGLDRTVTHRVGLTRLPWATLAVNVVGSFVLGFMLGWSAQVAAAGTADQAESARTLELILGIGFAGGLTTFSTFSWESWSLIRESRGRGVLVYAALTIGLGLSAVALGTAVGRMVA
ncbi:MAG TPA: CrcB family protein [Motilibacterales bacterium]|nr:CrcB family protein [Motilibacterales bacterium]